MSLEGSAASGQPEASKTMSALVPGVTFKEKISMDSTLTCSPVKNHGNLGIVAQAVDIKLLLLPF